MKVIAIYVYPPIPDRRFDWSAVGDGYEPGAPHGSGPTRRAAIENLCAQIEEAREVRFVPCEVCGTEGRILRQHVTNPYEEVDHGECPECKGTCVMQVEVEPVNELDEPRLAEADRLRDEIDRLERKAETGEQLAHICLLSCRLQEIEEAASCPSA